MTGRPLSDAQRCALVLRCWQAAHGYPVGSPKHRDAVLLTMVATICPVTESGTLTPWTLPMILQLQVRDNIGNPRPPKIHVAGQAVIPREWRQWWSVPSWRAYRRDWQHATDDDPMFPGHHGERIKRRAVQYAITRAGTRAGLPGLTLWRARYDPPAGGGAAAASR